MLREHSLVDLIGDAVRPYADRDEAVACMLSIPTLECVSAEVYSELEYPSRKGSGAAGGAAQVASSLAMVLLFGVVKWNGESH